jgi:hypothetical protein
MAGQIRVSRYFYYSAVRGIAGNIKKESHDPGFHSRKGK